MAETSDAAGNESVRRDGSSADEPPSVAVVSAVAELTGRSPVELTPLAEVVDPDALDGLFGDDGAPIRMTVEYCGCRVTVGPGGVEVTRLE